MPAPDGPQFNPVMGISDSIYDLRQSVAPHINTHRSGREVNLYLKKYMDTAHMNEVFAHTAHIAGNTEDARKHLDDVREALTDAHQVIAYNLGSEHPATKLYTEKMADVNRKIENFQWDSQF